MRPVNLLVVAVACSLPACQDGQFRLPEMNEVRTAFGAESEASEEGKSMGEVASSTGGDAKDGLDERFGDGSSASGNGSSGGAAAGGSSSVSSGGSGASGTSGTSSTSSSGGSSEQGSGAEASSAESASYAADAGAPTNRPEDVDVSGTERNGWSDAEVGWMAKLEMSGGMTMTQEVLEAREKVLLMETTTAMNGTVLSRSRGWMARLHPKVDVEPQTDVRVEDLGSKSIDVDGTSVSCEGSKTIWMQDGKETHSVGWSSEEVPGWLVQAETDAMGNGMEVTARLVAFRK